MAENIPKCLIKKKMRQKKDVQFLEAQWVKKDYATISLRKKKIKKSRKKLFFYDNLSQNF